jgi:hypothetical protein
MRYIRHPHPGTRHLPRLRRLQDALPQGIRAGEAGGGVSRERGSSGRLAGRSVRRVWRQVCHLSWIRWSMSLVG